MGKTRAPYRAKWDMPHPLKTDYTRTEERSEVEQELYESQRDLLSQSLVIQCESYGDLTADTYECIEHLMDTLIWRG